MKFLDKIRTPQKSNSIKRQVVAMLCILLFGVCMGVFSKFLDYRQAELPVLLQAIDNALNLHNFLGEFAPWIVIAVCISVYSSTPIRAAINVFIFFTGFVASYYIYSNFVAGFFPRSYALIWIAFTIISPFLGYISWYAKGTGHIALILSSGILGVLLNTAFSYGMFYIDIRSWLSLIMLLLGIFILRKSMKEIIGMMGTAILLRPFTGQACCSCPAVPVHLFAALSALNTGSDSPVIFCQALFPEKSVKIPCFHQGIFPAFGGH